MYTICSKCNLLLLQAPQPADAWEGTRDALEEGSVCPQYGVNAKEDCLFVNVYTTYVRLLYLSIIRKLV